MGDSEIIGVVPDFSFSSVRRPVAPFLFVIQPDNAPNLSLRLTGRQIPETLRAIDKTWAQVRGHDRIRRQFLDQKLQAQYADTILQGQMIGLGAALALIIACMGLFALSAYTAEQRTKEIGVRKAMGASTAQILGLMIWQFTQPVLWANLIAWPAAWWAMSRWLEGFAYHIDLSPWIFTMATVFALGIAWATVSVKAWMVARAKPIGALRYE
jgi:putative ABC transport system permease protein